MSFTASSIHCHPTSFRPITSIPTRQRAAARPPSAGRRDCLLFTAATVLTAVSLPSSPAEAKDIPLFGLRKKIEKAEEIVKEGFESVEKGIDTVETGLESAEKEMVAAEKEIESVAESVSFGGFAQAGAVAGAELFGVLVATSIVNGILSPQKS